VYTCTHTHTHFIYLERLIYTFFSGAEDQTQGLAHARPELLH
jgi:hypothetical protein